MNFCRAAEEILPFLCFYLKARRLRRREDEPDILKTPNYTDYPTLTDEQLLQRLEEERLRGAALDEKTFKLTLSLAIGLTVLGTGAGALVNEIPVAGWRFLVAVGLAVSISGAAS